MNLSIRKDDDGFWLYLDGSKQALVKLESQSGMIHEMLEEALASDSKSDGIAQGRREIDQAFSMLERFGVPRERAVTIANGIDVLITRMHRKMESSIFEAKDHGRREAAEAYCNECCDPSARPDDCKCADLPIILGTASDEKTDKHATFPPHDNDGQTA
jgi:hypothetical protein